MIAVVRLRRAGDRWSLDVRYPGRPLFSYTGGTDLRSLIESTRNSYQVRRRNPVNVLLCPTCAEPAIAIDDATCKTLVGYYSPEGHDHDDNCRKRGLHCAAGHAWVVALRARCSAPACDWVGKLMCYCHEGEKIDAWPELPVRPWR